MLMKKNLEIRALQTLEKTEDNVVEGYALKFNKESRNLGGFVETISPEALDGVDLTDVRCFMDHDSSKLLGRTSSGTLQLNVDAIGLHFRCVLPDTSNGRDAMELVKRGDLNQCSFGFTVAKDKWIKGQNIMKRSINKIGSLLEISLVSIPAYDDTDVRVATRSLEEAVNELEKQRLEVELELLGL
uniref:Prohead serine protease n=1 Tax=Siphoviridae sp. ctu8P6 TaxID=2827282 RepID=A0A8S5R434_9CAUD|nr:MAG TPA: prohead serine protease [Siphoviridae sp. ctu8P6]